MPKNFEFKRSMEVKYAALLLQNEYIVDKNRILQVYLVYPNMFIMTFNLMICKRKWSGNMVIHDMNR